MLIQRLRSFLLPFLVSVLGALPIAATAGPFSSLYVFGDSLSDTGNLLGIDPDGPGPLLKPTRPFPFAGPYAGDRFSNGPLWVEYLANGLGLPGKAAPFFLGGNNFAFAGAQTGLFPPLGQDQIPGLKAQLGGIWAPLYAGVADPNALYVVVAGGNDMRDARSAPGGTATTRAAAALAAAENLSLAMKFLAITGAKNVMIANLPNLGYTPEAIFLGLQAESSDATNAFNANIPDLMAYGSDFLGLNMSLLNLAGLTDAIQANPASFGITDTSHPCAGFVGTTGVSCDQSAFSDILHPSALVHALIGREALRVFGIPEPDTLALFGLAFVALAMVRRQRRQAQ